MANSKSNGTKTTRSKASSTTGRKKTSKTSSRTASVKTQEKSEEEFGEVGDWETEVEEDDITEEN